jgi:hypothetical protein
MNQRELKQRLALNEALERDLNALQTPWSNGSGDDVTNNRHEFWCECTQPACGQKIALNKREWDEVRSDPDHFFVAPGHVDHRIAEVVTRSERYWVVEKQDEAAREVAERTDPVRHPVLEDE